MWPTWAWTQTLHLVCILHTKCLMWSFEPCFTRLARQRSALFIFLVASSSRKSVTQVCPTDFQSSSSILLRQHIAGISAKTTAHTALILSQYLCYTPGYCTSPFGSPPFSVSAAIHQKALKTSQHFRAIMGLWIQTRSNPHTPHPRCLASVITGHYVFITPYYDVTMLHCF